MTYLEIINDVLIRLREPVVTTANQTVYSTLIGKFVNDAKRQVEDAYAWNVLGRNITVTTASGTYEYALTGAGQKFQVIDVINATSNIGMRNVDFVSMNRKQNFSTPVSGIPSEYAFDGVSAGYDTKVSLYPRPDNVYNVIFSLTVPQATLTSDSTVIAVPDVLVAQNAYSRALIERGEDGGTSSSEAFLLYKSMLADYIALEGTRYPENQEFVSV